MKASDWTLADLPTGPPPPQVAEPFIAGDGSTIIYAPGGQLKGYTAVYLIKQVTERGTRVLILDFENHPHEWGRRARAMGFTAKQLALVDYRTPFGEYWVEGDLRGPLDMVRRYTGPLLSHPQGDTGLIVVDSYTTATGGEAAMGGAEEAQKFFKATHILSVPTLVLAHTAGGEKFPARPFGSVFVHNLARETWAIAKDEGSLEFADGVQTTVELRNMKANTAAIHKPVFLTFTFFKNGTVDVQEVKGTGLKLEELIREVLPPGSDLKLTVQEIVTALKTRGQSVKFDSVEKALKRNPEWFKAEDGPKGRRLWSAKS